MGVLGGHCASTAVFVNAHHSIGIRALILFGTDEQKKQWLPDLVSGKKLAAFALTEPEAGSDAGNVKTSATKVEYDGKKYYCLNGQKRYITNGAIASVLTVMARTEKGVTAFLVTPQMQGFKVVEPRMDKCGIRGTATAKLAFENMLVPAENILGQDGKGLRVALTVLDFGRTTFGASCTGAAKICLQATTEHANSRVQFKQPLGEFELVKKKIAYMAAHTFAMDCMTSQCAAFIDKGADDYMLETAMLKVFTTEALWTIVNDTMQIFGGQGYFSNEPYERMMRDARINMIGEGANDVLKAFIAVVGMKAVGESLKGVLDAAWSPLKNYKTLWNFGKEQLFNRICTPHIPVKCDGLYYESNQVATNIRDFGLTVQSCLSHFRKQGLKNRKSKDQDEEFLIVEQVLKSQYMQERLSDIVCDLYASVCTLSKLDQMLSIVSHPLMGDNPSIVAGKHFLTLADRRIKQNTAMLWDNDDVHTTKTANLILKKFSR
jgi:alkylation response protein AidB-like acyl-CoA dehydrogenase